MGDTLANLRISCIEIYNGSNPSLGLGSIDPNCEWLKSGEFDIYLLLTDASIAGMICQRRGQARKTFLTGSQAGIANGALLNGVVGPVETIQFTVTGGRWAGQQPGGPPRGGNLVEQLEELRIESRNPTANPEIAPHYVQDGESIFHNAAGIVLGGASSVSVNATFPVFTYNQAATSAQCPGDFSAPTVYGALAAKFASDGHKTDAASYFNGLFKTHLQMRGVQAQ